MEINNIKLTTTDLDDLFDNVCNIDNRCVFVCNPIPSKSLCSVIRIFLRNFLYQLAEDIVLEEVNRDTNEYLFYTSLPYYSYELIFHKKVTYSNGYNKPKKFDVTAKISEVIADKRALSRLTDFGISTIEELVFFSKKEISNMPGIGRKCIDEIERALFRNGFKYETSGIDKIPKSKRYKFMSYKRQRSNTEQQDNH